MSNHSCRKVVFIAALPSFAASVIVGYFWYQYYSKKKKKNCASTDNSLDNKNTSSHLQLHIPVNTKPDCSNRSLDIHSPIDSSHNSQNSKMTCIQEETEVTSTDGSMMDAAAVSSSSTNCEDASQALSDSVIDSSVCSGKVANDLPSCSNESQQDVCEEVFTVKSSHTVESAPSSHQTSTSAEVVSEKTDDTAAEDADDEEDEDDLAQELNKMSLYVDSKSPVRSNDGRKVNGAGCAGDDDDIVTCTSPTDSGVHMTTSPIDESVHQGLRGGVGGGGMGRAVRGSRPNSDSSSGASSNGHGMVAATRPVPVVAAVATSLPLATHNLPNATAETDTVDTCISAATSDMTGPAGSVGDAVVMDPPPVSASTSDDTTSAAPTPTHTPVTHQRRIADSAYEFLIPSALAGTFIGRHGSHIRNLQDKSSATVCVRQAYMCPGFQMVSIRGAQSSIDRALTLVRNRFPVKHYPEMTLQCVDDGMGRVRTEPLCGPVGVDGERGDVAEAAAGLPDLVSDLVLPVGGATTDGMAVQQPLSTVLPNNLQDEFLF